MSIVQVLVLRTVVRNIRKLDRGQEHILHFRAQEGLNLSLSILAHYFSVLKTNF